MTTFVEKPAVETIVAKADQLLGTGLTVEAENWDALLQGVEALHGQVSELVGMADHLGVINKKHMSFWSDNDPLRADLRTSVRHARNFARAVLDGRQRTYGSPDPDWQQAVLRPEASL